MCYRFNRTMGSPSSWKTLWTHGTHSNRHCDKLGWTNQNWQQRVKYCSKKICAMLANTLSVASTLCTWSRYRIYRTRISNSVAKLSHQRCVHNCKKPQSNAACERMHQTVRNVLRTLLHGNSLQNIANAEQYVDKALSIEMHAMRAGVHTTLCSSPGNLVFNREMF